MSRPSALTPITGPYDARSDAAALRSDAWRLVQNFEAHDTADKLRRSPGWKKLMAGLATHRDYNNEDLHDQLLTLQTYYDVISSDDSAVRNYPSIEDDEWSCNCGNPTAVVLEHMEQVDFIDPLVDGPVDGVVSVTFSPVTKSLYILRRSTPEIYEFDTDANYIRTITLSNFTDVEGICWMHDNTFAITEENPNNRITIVTINATQTTLNRSNFTAYSYSTGLSAGDSGVEGCGYDSLRDVLYFTTQTAYSGAWKLWKMSAETGAVSEVCSIQSTVGATVTDISDIYYDFNTQRVFMLSNASSAVVGINLSGEIVSYLAITGFDAPGGLTFMPNMATMFVVGQDSQFGRYEKLDSFLNTRSQGRQPVTFIKSIEATNGQRKLLAGTQSRLYALHQRRGNYRILVDGMGGTVSNPKIRWQHASMGDYQFFTNNYNPVLYWPFDGPVVGCEQQAARPVPELQTMGISRAVCVKSWKGVCFIANTEEDGRRRPGMIRWCNYNEPLEWIEDPGFRWSGHQELDNEEVMGFGELGDFLWVFTNRGIWRVAAVDSADTLFSIIKIYSAPKGEACVAYIHTIIEMADGVAYMGKDGIYIWSLYSPSPERPEWIHRASAVIYTSLNRSVCSVHTAWYLPEEQKAFFSVAQGTDTLPSVTLQLNMKYRHANTIDHGFTAGTAHVPDDYLSIADWVIENGVCTEETLATEAIQALGWVETKEGEAVPSTNDPPSQHPSSIYTDIELDLGDGIVTEDYEQMVAADESLCALLGDTIIQDACETCENTPIHIVASASDYCLKQVGDVYYRETFNPTTEVYTQDGYTSRLLKCIPGTGGTIAMSYVGLKYSAEDQAEPSDLNLSVGASTRAEDPLRSCGIQWSVEGGLPLECADNDRDLEWNVWAADSYVYLDLTITGVGGAASFTTLTVVLQNYA
jgi:uncharacterized protein YjiK